MAQDFEAAAFAGGGNRCYWQGGFWEALNEARPQKPQFIVGVSAGAFQACFTVLGLGEHVRGLVLEACGTTTRGYDWRRLAQGRSPFLVGDMYRALLEDVFGPKEIRALHALPEILIQLAHPPRFLPAPLAAMAAIGAYQIEKLVTGAAYSRAGRYVGLRPSWVSTHAMQDPAELVAALMATSSVPPFMPIGRAGGLAALDGGLVDNPPLEKLAEAEWQGRRTLVLASRASAPPSTALRTVVRPSVAIAVDKFSVTDAAGIRAAYELGLKDGAAFAQSLGGRTRKSQLRYAPTP